MNITTFNHTLRLVNNLIFNNFSVYTKPVLYYYSSLILIKMDQIGMVQIMVITVCILVMAVKLR